MQKYFWFYLTLQAMVLLLIFQSAYEKRRLQAQKRAEECSLGKLAGSDRQGAYNTQRKCVKQSILEQFLSLGQKMKQNIHGILREREENRQPVAAQQSSRIERQQITEVSNPNEQSVRERIQSVSEVPRRDHKDRASERVLEEYQYKIY